MRMWMVPPKVLCGQHLTGEHYETHMTYGALAKNKPGGVNLVKALCNKGMMELSALQDRHDALAAELLARGGNHKSPLIFEWEMFRDHYDLPDTKVDVMESMMELHKRCPKCRVKIDKWFKENPEFRQLKSES